MQVVGTIGPNLGGLCIDGTAWLHNICAISQKDELMPG